MVETYKCVLENINAIQSVAVFNKFILVSTSKGLGIYIAPTTEEEAETELDVIQVLQTG